MSDYLRDVQWAVRPVTVAPDRRQLGPDVRVNEGCIVYEEVRKAAEAYAKAAEAASRI